MAPRASSRGWWWCWWPGTWGGGGVEWVAPRHTQNFMSARLRGHRRGSYCSVVIRGLRIVVSTSYVPLRDDLGRFPGFPSVPWEPRATSIVPGSIVGPARFLIIKNYSEIKQICRCTISIHTLYVCPANPGCTHNVINDPYTLRRVLRQLFSVLLTPYKNAGRENYKGRRLSLYVC
jgi:hypothetical protein